MSTDPMDMVIGSADAGPRDELAAGSHLARAREAEEQGDRAKAVVEFRRAVAADPQNADAMFRLAYCVDLLGEEEEAIVLYERCCERSPAPVNALLNLAVLYEDRADYVRSERCLRQILDTNPNHPRARLFMKDVQASREMVVEEDHDRDIMKRKALMDTPVTDFELSVRARTCLKKMNIRTLGDLLRITEAELMSYKNFGESSLEEIKKMLAQKGLKLGQGLEDAHRAARRQIMERLKGTGKEALLNKAVSDLQLSVRARKALTLLNIQSLGDLVSHTEAELMGVKNFGATSLVEVKAKLDELGLELRTLDEEEQAALEAGLGPFAAGAFGAIGDSDDDDDEPAAFAATDAFSSDDLGGTTAEEDPAAAPAVDPGLGAELQTDPDSGPGPDAAGGAPAIGAQPEDALGEVAGGAAEDAIAATPDDAGHHPADDTPLATDDAGVIDTTATLAEPEPEPEADPSAAEDDKPAAG